MAESMPADLSEEQVAELERQCSPANIPPGFIRFGVRVLPSELLALIAAWRDRASTLVAGLEAAAKVCDAVESHWTREDYTSVERAIIKRATAAIRSLKGKPVPDAEEWQPIETAPKDGAVDLWVVDRSREDAFRMPASYFSDGKWYDRECYNVEIDGKIATHWMPLPLPPAALKGKAGG